jgi:hypothetical protein
VVEAAEANVVSPTVTTEDCYVHITNLAFITGIVREDGSRLDLLRLHYYND